MDETRWNMTKSERLQPVAKIALQREQRAAQALAAAQRQMLDRGRRLDELRGYRQEYQTQFSAADDDPRTAYRITDFRAFLQRLDQLIMEHERLYQVCKSEYESKKKAWMSLHGKTQALDKAISNFRQDEQGLADRREQREADDRITFTADSDLDDF